MLNGHADPTLYIFKCHNTTICNVTLYVIAKYVPETNMHPILGICAIHAKYLKGIYGRCICIYIIYQVTTASTMQQGALYT